MVSRHIQMTTLIQTLVRKWKTSSTSCVCSVLSVVKDTGWLPTPRVFISAVATQSERCPVFVPGVCAALPWQTAREGQTTEADPQASGAPQHVPCGRHLLWDRHDRQKSPTGRMPAHPSINKQTSSDYTHRFWSGACWHTSQERVAVVEARANKSLDQNVHWVLVEGQMYPPDVVEKESARAGCHTEKQLVPWKEE